MSAEPIHHLAVARSDARLGRGAYADLLLLVGLALLLPALLLLPIPLLRVPLGLGLVLLAPGYALQAALFPRRADLDGPARGAASFGLSLAALPLLALLLDRLPWGIRPWPIALALAGWIVGWCGVAALRRRWGAGEEPTLPRAAFRVAPPRQRIGAALLAGAAIGLVLWCLVAFSRVSPPPLTEFYALGAAGQPADFPREVAPGEPMEIRLGIANHEGAPTTYRVEVRAGDQRLAAYGPLTVADGALVELPARYALPHAGDDQPITLLLFRSDEFTPYRRLTLWVNVWEPR